MTKARFNLKVDAVVMPGRTVLDNVTFRAGDLFVSDGKRSWGMRFEDALEHLQPCTVAGKALFAEAEALNKAHPKPEQTEIR